MKMNSRLFKNLYRSSKSKARLGEIKTDHGIIKTPAFVPVATQGSIKALPPSLIKEVGVQAAFVNTYHLVTHPGTDVIEKAGGIHKFANLKIPLMSDSGGFQIFSLARKKEDKHQKTKIKIFQTDEKKDLKPLIVKISDNGVTFRSVFDGERLEFTPEKSIGYQREIGADLLMAFDECTYYPATKKYAEKAMERTHRWLMRCINQVQSSKCKVQNDKSTKYKKNNQFFYGIIQGGMYEDLRKKSAEFVVSQDVDGVAIGGVSVGESKKEMRNQVSWVSDYLPKDRPVHLLGVGQIDDIIDLVQYGVDTFDCVEPTRLGRMGQLYRISKQFSNFQKPISKANNIDILRGKYRYDLSAVDENCRCYVCVNFTKSYLHHLFKQRELLGYTLATYHNLWVMEKIFDKIREMIINNQI